MYGGRNDLAYRRLRHISDAFAEDPLRVLRAARFAARLDFTVAPETMDLLKQMVLSGELNTIKPERICSELLEAITGKAPWVFFEVLQESGALQTLELDVVDLSHSITCLMRASEITLEPVVRTAAFFYNTVVSTGSSEALKNMLRLPADHVKLLDLLMANAADMELAANADPEACLRLISAVRAEQQADRWKQFLQAGSAIRPEQAQRAKPNLSMAMEAVSSVSAADLQQKGMSGKNLGAELYRLRLEAVRSSLSC
jgi:tRNA nucleotidyltransferase (CCA-adding enzyme)